MKNIFPILLYSLIFTSCELSKPNHEVTKTIQKDQTETKYAKVISDPTNQLNGQTENLEVEYTVWGCACPNWIQTTDNVNRDTTQNYLSQHFYIEPANKSLELPDEFDAAKHQLKLTGQFYVREDYPQGTIEMEEPMPKAKVFRYTKLELVQIDEK